jgi:hypothetical protein
MHGSGHLSHICQASNSLDTLNYWLIGNSTLFALSVDKQLLQGHLVWYVMAAIGVGGVVASNRLKALVV